MVGDKELYEWLAPLRTTAVVDVGASDIGQKPSYQPLVDRGIASVIGFEPQADLFAELATRASAAESYLPYALGDGETHTLHVCAHAPMSSFLKPDARQLKQFVPMTDWGKVVAEVPMPTRRLDDIGEIAAIDFLKMDVQGFELTILRHGRGKLAQAVAVQVEVPFVLTYEQQPNFGEIDLELRAQGFVAHMFAEMLTRMLAPLLPPEGTWQGLNQLHEGDLIYVRDFARADLLADEQLKHLALLAHYCFRSFDLAYRALLVLSERKAVAASVLRRYEELLQTAGAPDK